MHNIPLTDVPTPSLAGRGMFSCEASRVDPSRRRDEIPIPSRQDNSPPRFHHLRLNSNCVEGLGNFPPIMNKRESVHRGQGVRRGSSGPGARLGGLRTRRRCEGRRASTLFRLRGGLRPSATWQPSRHCRQRRRRAGRRRPAARCV